jgi:motility quorum-sensing regulator / GCU-specific mRNA interferase toxin
LEKRKPSHDLEAFKRVCGDPARLRMTFAAEQSAEELGYEPWDVAALIRTMDRRMFYKSMTSFSNHKQWQDVYHVPADDGLTLYMKFTDDILTEFVLLSFKER